MYQTNRNVNLLGLPGHTSSSFDCFTLLLARYLADVLRFNTQSRYGRLADSSGRLDRVPKSGVHVPFYVPYCNLAFWCIKYCLASSIKQAWIRKYIYVLNTLIWRTKCNVTFPWDIRDCPIHVDDLHGSLYLFMSMTSCQGTHGVIITSSLQHVQFPNVSTVITLRLKFRGKCWLLTQPHVLYNNTGFHIHFQRHAMLLWCGHWTWRQVKSLMVTINRFLTKVKFGLRVIVVGCVCLVCVSACVCESHWLPLQRKSTKFWPKMQDAFFGSGGSCSCCCGEWIQRSRFLFPYGLQILIFKI